MRWTEDELLLALHLYERIPFGQQDKSNQQVIELAEILGRTPSSVAMKLSNFTSLDPAEAARGIRGLVNASSLDRKMWELFRSDPAAVAKAEEAWTNRFHQHSPEPIEEFDFTGPTEVVAPGIVRLGQRFFRRAVLTNFDHRCALTGLGDPSLLSAIHIVGWAEDPMQRVNVANGLCLNKLHEAAFTRKLITFDDSLCLIVGDRVRRAIGDGRMSETFLKFEGAPLAPTVRRPISKALLARHREAFEREERRAA